MAAVGGHQYGAGRPAGAQTLVHAVRAVTDARPDHAWIRVYVAIVFLSVSRRAVLEAVEEYASHMTRLSGAVVNGCEDALNLSCRLTFLIHFDREPSPIEARALRTVADAPG